MVTFSTQLVLKNTMPLIGLSVLSQFLAFSVSFYVFLVLKPHRKQLSAMRNLALFKEPAL